MSNSNISLLGDGAPTTANYVVRTANVRLPNARVMSTFAAGMVRNDAVGNLSIATPSVDFWQPSTSFPYEYLTAHTANNSALIDIDTYRATHAELLILVEGLYASAGTPRLGLRTSVNNGTSYGTSGYHWCNYLWSPSLTGVDVNASDNDGDSHAFITRASSASDENTISGRIVIDWMQNSVTFTRGLAKSQMQLGDATMTETWYAINGLADKIRFMFETGNMQAGRITIYGKRKES
jgi:hypothetical protein